MMTLDDRPLAGATVVFDLDGTLVDSAPDLHAAMNHALAHEGLPPVPLRLVRNMVGRGARAMIARGREAAGVAPAEATVDRLYDEFIAYYMDHICDLGAPFEGVDETLERLARAGAGLAVCTNKRETPAHALLEATGLKPWFPSIVGADTVGIGKPDAKPLLEAIARVNGDAARAVMVGDSFPDVGAARNAGLPSIVCTFGYTEVPSADLGGTVLVDSFPEIWGAALKLLTPS